MKRTQLEIAEYNLWKAMNAQIRVLVRRSNKQTSIMKVIESANVSDATGRKFTNGGLPSIRLIEKIIGELKLDCDKELLDYKLARGYIKGLKICLSCNETKSIDQFYFDSSKDNYRSHCKKCYSEKTRQRYHERKMIFAHAAH